MATAPGYDPTMLTGSQRRKNFGSLILDTARPLLNRAIKGQYPPGSTYKPLSALIALDEGVINPHYGYPCSGGYYACGRLVKCTEHWAGHSKDLRTAIAWSRRRKAAACASAPDQQRQRAVRRLEFVALMLELLDAVQHVAQFRRLRCVTSKPSSRAFITMLLRPARSLMSTCRALPTSAGSMCS